MLRVRYAPLLSTDTAIIAAPFAMIAGYANSSVADLDIRSGTGTARLGQGRAGAPYVERERGQQASRRLRHSDRFLADEGDVALAMWAKSDRDAPGRWHPLVYHGTDAGVVAQTLLERAMGGTAGDRLARVLALVAGAVSLGGVSRRRA